MKRAVKKTPSSRLKGQSMIITIGGPIGSGKTTVARALAERFGFRHISAGEVFRSMANDMDISLEDFSKMAEKDSKWDRIIDGKQVEMAKKTKNAVIDGRLSGLMLDADLKIWLNAPLETRAMRVAKRESKGFERALKETKKREKSENKRYKEIYNLNMSDLTQYDVVLNTELWDANEVVSIIEQMVSPLRGGKIGNR